MDWGNAIVRKISGLSPIESLEMELNLDGDFKKTKKKIEEDDDVKDYITPNTEFRTEAVGDHNIKSLKKGDIIQFERKGYYIVDSAYGEKETVECILIPDGKASSVASKAAVPEKEKMAVPATSKNAEKGKGKSSEVKTKEKVGRIPEPAPKEAVETVLLSNGTKGFPQKVTTKMYRVEPVSKLISFERI
jgi:glutamyl-tRNA synthetase